MRRLAFATLALFSTATGCESLSSATSHVRAKLAEREAGRTRTYAASQRATYLAVRAAADQMGYRFVRGGAAQGFFEAVSGIGQGDANRSLRQIEMKVALRQSRDEGTEVNVRLTEIIQSESASRNVSATGAPLQGTPQYEVFLRSVQQMLDGQGTMRQSDKEAVRQ